MKQLLFSGIELHGGSWNGLSGDYKPVVGFSAALPCLSDVTSEGGVDRAAVQD